MALCYLYDEKDISRFSESITSPKAKELVTLSGEKILLPQTFIVLAEVSRFFRENKKSPTGFLEQLGLYMNRLESDCGKGLGDPDNPIVMTLRSAFTYSIKGIGITATTLPKLAERYGKGSVFFLYTNFLREFSTLVLGVSGVDFPDLQSMPAQEDKIALLEKMPLPDFLHLAGEYKGRISENAGIPFPEDPKDQLLMALKSLMSCSEEGLEEDLVIQEMVLATFSGKSVEGTFYTRNPFTGERDVYGIYRGPDRAKMDIKGEPDSPENLENRLPDVYMKIDSYSMTLENLYKDIMVIEFVTSEEGELYVINVTTAPKTARASVFSAVELYKSGLISDLRAIHVVKARDLESLMHPSLDEEGRKELHAFDTTGVAGSPGATTGGVFFSMHDALEFHAMAKDEDTNIVLVVNDLLIDDHGGLGVISGLVTKASGIASHGAVMARSKGIPCIAGFRDLNIDLEGKQMTLDGKIVRQGEQVTLEVTDRGRLFLGRGRLTRLSSGDGLLEKYASIMSEVQEREGVVTKIMVNINNAEDAQRGLDFGADGVGLLRTENLFISEERINLMREFLFLKEGKRKKEILETIALQVEDYAEVFRVMGKRPVVVRLMDMPLNDLMPSSQREVDSLVASFPHIPEERIRSAVKDHKENNPIFGLRGCRLAVLDEGLYFMQARAIISAAYKVAQEGTRPKVHIMAPLVIGPKEFSRIREIVLSAEERAYEHYAGASKDRIRIEIGAMIELPAAVLSADKIAVWADFFSFGTNDLSQATYGISREDMGRFVPGYLEKGIIDMDPFSSLGEEVRELIKIAVHKGRFTRPTVMFGVCGEQAADADTISFALENGIDYLSCSPYRVLPARLRLLKCYLAGKKGAHKG